MQQQHLRLLAALLSARHPLLHNAIAGVHEGLAELSGASATVHRLGCLHRLQQRLLVSRLTRANGRQGDHKKVEEQENKLQIGNYIYFYFCNKLYNIC